MARAFNLTAELNLRGPSNVRLIVADIRRQLGSITADVDIRVNPATSRNLGALNNTLANLNQTLTRTQTNANAVATAFNNMGRAIGAFNTNANNASRNVQNLSVAANNLNTNLTQANRQARQAGNEFEEFGRQSALAVRRFAAFATVTSVIFKFTNALSGATKEFIDFNRELVRVAQVTDSALKDLNPLVGEITRLSSGLGVASQDLIQVSSTLAQAGLSARDTERALKALALSALAPSFDDLNETVEGSIALMRQFGISASGLEDALGSVNAVAAKFAVEASDLITAIQRTGGVFATASRGVSEGKDALNEFLAVFTSIRQTTRESAETIATGLRTIFTRIQRQDTIEALQGLGIELRNTSGQFVGAFEAVRRLSQGLSKIDPRSREFAAISEELGGFRQIGKVIPLIQQFAVAQEALKVAQQGQGSLARDAATAQQSVANQITKVREEFNALVRSIGQSDSFQTFVKLSLDLASALIKLADSAKTVLPALTAIAAIRGASAIGSFATGFVGGLRRQNSGGYIRRFASGGLVPGSGNGDTIPAMLTPGEFVIRKNAVKTIGLGSLQSMNKYASGGRVQKFNAGGYSDEEWSKEMESIRRKYKLPSSSEIDAMSPAQKKAYEDRLGEIAFSSPSPGREKKAILAMKQRSARKSALGLFFSAAGMKRGPKAPAGMFEQTRAKYQGLGGITSVKPKFIAWGKGQGSFGDIVRGSEDKIRSQLSGVSLSHFNSLLQAGTLQNYLASGGKQGHIPPLKKAIYNILGVTGKNSGGYIQKFEKGGMAERKITRNMGDGTTGPRMFGLVGLRSGLSDSESLPTSLLEKTKTPKNRDVQLNIGTLSNSYKNGLDNQIENDLYQSFATSVIKTGDTLAKQIGANTKPNQSKINKVLKGSSFTTVVGAALESALGLIGSPYLDKTESTKALDFPLGLGKAAGLFGIPSRVPTDVTRTVGGFGKGSTQILNQIDRFIDATEAGEFTKAMKGKIRDRKGATLTPMLSSIKEKLGDKPVSAVAQAGIAFKLRKKYGLGRGGLNKPSLEGSLSGLPTGQQRRFLDDLDSVATTGTFADASKYAKGGNVDNVPALLTPGEFVINKKAASRIGSSRLHQLNRADRIQGFNKGGVVQRFVAGGPILPAQPVDPSIIPDLSMPVRELSETVNKRVYELAKSFKQMGMSTKEALEEARKQAEQLSPTAQSISQQAQTKQQARIERKAAVLGIDPTMTGSRRAAENRGDTGGQVGVTAATRQYVAQTYGQSSGLQAVSQGLAARAASVGPVASNQFNPQGLYSGLSKLTGALSQGSGSVAQFAASVKAAPIATFNAAIKQAGTGLLQVAKSGIGGGAGAIGRGAGGMISRIGGGVLNSLGLGRVGSAGGAAGGAAATGGMGSRMGGMSGMGAMIATMAGGTIVDSLASAAGGEKTDTGRTISAVGSNVLNYGAMGAAIGGPWGAAAGAAIGLAAGLMEAKKAGEEYAQAQLESKAQIATEKSGQAIAAYSADPRKAGGREAAFAALTQATTAEDAAMNNKQTQKVGFFGKAANFLTMGAAGYRDQTTAELAESNMKGQEEGAKQARELLSLEMTRTGKTFAEISKSMKPEELKMLANNIAQADQNYVYFQTQRALEIKKLKDQGRNAEAAALQDQTNKEQAALAENIAARSMKETDAGIMAQRAAAASAAMGIALEKATMTLEKSFEAMSQSLNKFGSTIEQSAKAREQIVSGQASLTGNTFNRDADILQNPSAYSTRERQQAMNRSASMLGSQGNLAVRTANFSGNVSDEASRLVANAPAGEDQAVTGQRLQATLIARIRETFGADTTLGRTLSANVSEVIQKKIDEAKEKGTAIDFNELVESALGPINKASQQASELLIKANERLAKSFEELGATSQAIADLQQQQADRTASLLEMQGTSRVGQKEALGMKVGLQERLMLRANAAARGTGLQGNQLNVANLVNRRAQLAQQQGQLQARQAELEPSAATSPFAQQQLFKLQQNLAKVNGELANTDKALENLPQALEGAISDVTAEMSKRVGELEATKEAGAGFAEKLVGSTPQELQALGNTFNLLNNTLRGNITTIQNSKVAQQAYVASLQQGKTKQEALADAQSAFATENKNALSMFNELSQMSGVKGPEMDRMRADLLENFAKAQAAGLERSPMFQKIISQLRMDPAQRAASDPVLKALQTQAEALRAQQAAATAELNAKNDQQMKLLEATGAKLVQDINDAKLDVEISVRNAAARAGVEVPQARARGGIIYASNGTLARGTDTVPAMLTPGEFVVNAKATRQNLPLLQSINRSKGGSVRYFAEGGLNDISGVGAQTARNIQTNTMKENNRVQNNILSGVKNLGQKSESIKNDTAYATSNQLPNLSDVTYDSKELNSQNFGYLTNLTEKIYGFTGNMFSKGGPVYASKGKLINFEPKGTDTVPAMLTPGEFVVNRAATQKNLPLLQSINSGVGGYSNGGVIYAQDGTMVPQTRKPPQRGSLGRLVPLPGVPLSRESTPRAALPKSKSEIAKPRLPNPQPASGKDSYVDRYIQFVEKQRDKVKRDDTLFRLIMDTMTRPFSDEDIDTDNKVAKMFGLSASILSRSTPIRSERELRKALANFKLPSRSDRDKLYPLTIGWPNETFYAEELSTNLDTLNNIGNIKIRDALIAQLMTKFSSDYATNLYRNIDEEVDFDQNMGTIKSSAFDQNKMLIDKKPIMNFKVNDFEPIYAVLGLDELSETNRSLAAEKLENKEKIITGYINAYTDPGFGQLPLQKAIDQTTAQYQKYKKGNRRPGSDPPRPDRWLGDSPPFSTVRTLDDLINDHENLIKDLAKQTNLTELYQFGRAVMLGKTKLFDLLSNNYRSQLDSKTPTNLTQVNRQARQTGSDFEKEELADFSVSRFGRDDIKTPTPNQPFRRWFSYDNKKAIVGQMMSVVDNTKTDDPVDYIEFLRQTNNKKLLVNKFKFSKFDQDYINSVAASLPAKPDSYSSGGTVYASNGKLINFQPKGTDTVPAMLTPGEFVVNRQATQKNLPLLQTINGGAKGYSRGGTVYLADGGEVSLAEDVANKNLWSINDYFDNLKKNEQTFISNPRNRFLIYNKQGRLSVDLQKDLTKDDSPLSLISARLRGVAAIYRKNEDGGGQEAKNIQNIDPKAQALNDRSLEMVRTKFLRKEIMLAKQAMSGKNEAPTYEGAVLDEIRRYPQLFEKYNPDAFTEIVDPARIQKFFDNLQTDEQKEQALSIIADRDNYLSRIILNNKKAYGAFEKKESDSRERAIAREAVMFQGRSAIIEQAIIQNGFLNRPEFKGKTKPPNRFENNLFDVESIPSSVEEILSAKGFNRGGVVYANNGQLINFQPRGRDTVPAMLTPGEFVVNKNAAQKNLSLLQGMNSGQVSYLSKGTPGSDMFASLTQAITLGAKQLNTAFLEAIQQLTTTVNNNLPNTLPQSQASPNGVSNITAANIDLLGSRLDRFIEQLQAALPPVIRVEGQHDVNVVINGASALQNLLQGPISSLIQTAIQSAFNAKSRENEGN